MSNVGERHRPLKEIANAIRDETHILEFLDELEPHGDPSKQVIVTLRSLADELEQMGKSQSNIADRIRLECDKLRFSDGSNDYGYIDTIESLANNLDGKTKD